MTMLTLIENDRKSPAGRIEPLLRQHGVPYRLLRPQDDPLPEPGQVAAAVVLGGSMGAHDEAAYPFLRPLKGWMDELLRQRTPLLGICLGGQLLAEVAGGAVLPQRHGETGVCPLALLSAAADDPLLAGISPTARVFQWHDDSFRVPQTARLLAASDACPQQAFRLGSAWGVQFHPEVEGTVVADWCRDAPEGERLWRDFLRHEAELAALGERLLGNFLRLALPGR